MDFETLQISLVILTGVIYVAAMFLLWSRFKKRRLEREQKDAAFLTKFVRSIENGACSDVKDAETLYMAHYECGALPIIDYERLVLFIRKAVGGFSTHSGGLTNRGKQYLDMAKSLLVAAESKLEKMSREAPFSETPNPERQMLEDLRSMISDHSGRVTAKLHDLARAIRDRELQSNLSAEQAATSLLYAKRGIWLTIVIGIVSVGITIWFSP